MQRATRLRLALTAAALLLLAGGVWALNQSRVRHKADAARAQALLAEARDLLGRSASEKLLDLAAEAFRAAAAECDRTQGLLDRGAASEAVPAAEAALARVRAARAEAEGRTPIAHAAVLKAARNSVLHRAAGGVEWSDAKVGMSLFDQDRLSTPRSGIAIVRFEEGSEMRVEENSVMVVERLTRSRVDPTLAMTLSVPQGNVRTAVARDGGRDVRLEINLPRAGVVIDTAAIAGHRAEIATGVEGDSSNRVAVYTGEARVVSPTGQELVLKQNQYATVDSQGMLSAARELPTAAIILLPGRDAVIYTSVQRPEVTFKWQVTGNCAGYRIEVAKDIEFLDRLVDEKVKRTQFTYGNLRPGRYYWRISCLGGEGQQGGYTETNLFEVRIDNEAPQLQVLAPAANAVVSAASIEARCKSEPGASVFINGEEARLSDGQFARMVSLNPGLNTVVFEAVDEAGNVIYNSRLVTRR